jgi:hypothetical protein
MQLNLVFATIFAMCVGVKMVCIPTQGLSPFINSYPKQESLGNCLFIIVSCNFI